MKPGVHTLPFADYHALEAWGSSSLRAMRRGPPARVQWEHDNPTESTDAMRIGSAAHCRFLTSELYGDTYVHKPTGMTFASKEGKAWRDDHAGFEIIPATDAVDVQRIVEALCAKEPVSKSIAKATHREATLLWECHASGELCKGRPDWIEGNYLYDLKISRHASGGALAYRAYMDGWMHQVSHYRAGCLALGMTNVLDARLVVVSPSAPHYVYCLQVKGDTLDLLDLENQETLKEMAECRKTGRWDDTSNEWRKVEAPASALLALGGGQDLLAQDEGEEAF